MATLVAAKKLASWQPTADAPQAIQDSTGAGPSKAGASNPAAAAACGKGMIGAALAVGVAGLAATVGYMSVYSS